MAISDKLGVTPFFRRLLAIAVGMSHTDIESRTRRLTMCLLTTALTKRAVHEFGSQ